MALVVETGSASATAESYISVADADLYFSNRGNAAWAALSTTQKEQNLRKATDYMVGVYRLRWKGYRKTATQALDWPRSFVYLEAFTQGAVGSYPYLVGDTVVPNEVKNACCELAIKAATAELAADLSRGVLSEKIDAITIQYDPASPEAVRYRAVDNMLATYLKSKSFELVPS